MFLGHFSILISKYNSCWKGIKIKFQMFRSVTLSCLCTLILYISICPLYSSFCYYTLYVHELKCLLYLAISLFPFDLKIQQKGAPLKCRFLYKMCHKCEQNMSFTVFFGKLIKIEQKQGAFILR